MYSYAPPELVARKWWEVSLSLRLATELLKPRYVFSLCESTGDALSDQTDVLQGTLDLLILRTISLEPMHGWAIAQRIQQISDDLLRVQQGSLYPALHRLEHQGWIVAEWGASENNRRARFYSLTKPGRKQLEIEVAKWERLSAGVNLVLNRT